MAAPLLSPNGLILIAVLLARADAGLVLESALPLRTQGRYIVNAGGSPVRLQCVNWYGAHLEQMVMNGLNKRTLPDLADQIKHLGFNCVRVPYSLELLNATVIPDPNVTLKANPLLIDLSPLKLFDATINALTTIGLLVILNNHISSARWCCTAGDGEGLWFTQKYNYRVWLDHVVEVARRYQNNSRVVGFDLRNEIRPSSLGWPTWGTGTEVDWSAAAAEAGKLALKENDKLLIIVSGLMFGIFLCDVDRNPIHVNTPELVGHVVYEAHEYPWMNFHYSVSVALWICAKFTGFCMLMYWTGKGAAWILKLIGIIAVDRPNACCSRLCRSPCRRSRCCVSSTRSTKCELTVTVGLSFGSLLGFVAAPKLVNGCDDVSWLGSLLLILLSAIVALICSFRWLRLVLRAVANLSLDLPETDGTARIFEHGPTSETESGSSSFAGAQCTVSAATSQSTDSANTIPRKSAVFALRRACASNAKKLRSKYASLFCIHTGVLLSIAFISEDLGKYENIAKELDTRWGYLLHNADASAPVWLGEFGTSYTNMWWKHTLRYVVENKVGWAYWSLNGEKWNDNTESYGILGEDETTIENWKLDDIRSLMVVDEDH